MCNNLLLLLPVSHAVRTNLTHDFTHITHWTTAHTRPTHSLGTNARCSRSARHGDIWRRHRGWHDTTIHGEAPINQFRSQKKQGGLFSDKMASSARWTSVRLLSYAFVVLTALALASEHNLVENDAAAMMKELPRADSAAMLSKV